MDKQVVASEGSREEQILVLEPDMTSLRSLIFEKFVSFSKKLKERKKKRHDFVSSFIRTVR